MKKTYKIIMLPNKEEPTIGKIVQVTTPYCSCINVCDCERDSCLVYIDSKLTLQGVMIDKSRGYVIESVELYILSDEEIEEKNWYLANSKYIRKALKCYKDERMGNCIVYNTIDGTDCVNIAESCEKIIASTQKLPKSYIEYYIKVANENGKPIDYIELEMESGSDYKNPSINKKDEVCPIIPICNKCIKDCTGCKYDMYNKEQSIEEATEGYDPVNLAAIQYFTDNTINNIPTRISVEYNLPALIGNAFIAGAKHQASKMYSEEDLINFGEFISDRLPDVYSRFDADNEFKEWFKENKKK